MKLLAWFGRARLRRDRRGNVAIITALAAIPLLGMVGLAVDVGNATSAHTSLDAAADSAALLATTVASNQFQGGVSNPVAAAQTAATARFNAQAVTLASVTLGTVNVAVTQSGTTFNSTVTYTASYKAALAPLLGVKTFNLSGVSSASMSINPYVDIQVLMDVSASMLIAATANDMTNMETVSSNFVAAKNEVLPDNVGQQCAFACHWNTQGTDYLAAAQRAGVTLRINVLQSAVSNMITTIASYNTQAHFRLGMSTFAQAFNTIYAMNSNITGATTALPQIAPDVNMCSSNCPETYFDNAMSTLGANAGTSGNGSSQATSQKYLFIITDGLVDQMTNGNRVIGPINPASCAAMKAQGITILTLYTKYLPIPNNSFYMSNVWPYQSMGDIDDIEQALISCASAPNLEFRATSSSQIDSQLQTMLATVLQSSGHFTR